MLGARSSSTICKQNRRQKQAIPPKGRRAAYDVALLPSSKMDSTRKIRRALSVVGATKNREAIRRTDSRKAYTPRPARSRALLHCTTDYAAVLSCLHWLSTFSGLKSEALLSYCFVVQYSSSISSSIYSTVQSSTNHKSNTSTTEYRSSAPILPEANLTKARALLRFDIVRSHR